jgi:UDP-N-acetylglucosamine acyltransferase
VIHATAIVHPDARLAPDVEIGAYTVVDAHVEIGAQSRIGHHCVITGHTRIGARNRIFHSCSLGEIPQDKKYDGAPTRLEIGDDNTIREFATFNTGTSQDLGVTRIGDGNWFMAYSHVAHDCEVGNHTIFANCAQIAGHVKVGDYAILGGFTSSHQFCSVGPHAITGLGSVILQDIPPYVTASGNPAKPFGINSEGLRRRGFASDTISLLRQAYKTLYRSGLGLDDAKAAIAASAGECEELRVFLGFLDASRRGLAR